LRLGRLRRNRKDEGCLNIINTVSIIIITVEAGTEMKKGSSSFYSPISDLI